MTSHPRISKISGPTVTVKGLDQARMYDRVLVGRARLLGEIIRLHGAEATVQVYEDTTGLCLGEEVRGEGEPLMAELGPGLLGSIFDGVQRPLDMIRSVHGDRIPAGVSIPSLKREKRWYFRPVMTAGEEAGPGDVVGEVQETSGIVHRVMVPPGWVSGRIAEIKEGEYAIDETVALLEDGRAITMMQKWPVRIPRPVRERLHPSVPFVTGQRVLDTLFPVAAGGTAVIPGGFGCGKTVVEQTLAKYAASHVVVYVGCGERGNEMAELLGDFPKLTDPATGEPLMRRTVLVVNTSNMPVAAREASIYTGVTIAEYYRDMGYDVALMADSTSRWAEALREISSRLEEMPGEEGFPTYLGTRLAGFYERGGRCIGLGREGRIGSATIVGAISPPGGDFSEPVTQSSLRVAGAVWALDPDLAYRRHFPAISWDVSYTLYFGHIREWLHDNIAGDWEELRAELMALLQKEEELLDIIQLVGADAIPEREKVIVDVCRMIREEYLRQNAFSETDAFCPLKKQHALLSAFLLFYRRALELLDRERSLDEIVNHPLKSEIIRAKELPAERFDAEMAGLMKRLGEL